MIGDTWEKDKLGDTWRETNDEKQMKANKKYTQSQKPLDSMKTNEVVNHICVSEQQSFEKAGRQVDDKGDKNEPHHPGDCWGTTSGKPHLDTSGPRDWNKNGRRRKTKWKTKWKQIYGTSWRRSAMQDTLENAAGCKVGDAVGDMLGDKVGHNVGDKVGDTEENRVEN